MSFCVPMVELESLMVTVRLKGGAAKCANARCAAAFGSYQGATDVSEKRIRKGKLNEKFALERFHQGRRYVLLRTARKLSTSLYAILCGGIRKRKHHSAEYIG